MDSDPDSASKLEIIVGVTMGVGSLIAGGVGGFLAASGNNHNIALGVGAGLCLTEGYLFYRVGKKEQKRDEIERYQRRASEERYVGFHPDGLLPQTAAAGGFTAGGILFGIGYSVLYGLTKILQS